MDPKIVQVALSGLENILRLGLQEAKSRTGPNPYAILIEECYGIKNYSQNFNSFFKLNSGIIFNFKFIFFYYFKILVLSLIEFYFFNSANYHFNYFLKNFNLTLKKIYV